jgi:hypothetical protein
MSEPASSLDQQIAALEQALALPLPDTTRAQLEQDLRALHAQRSKPASIQGSASVGGTLYGNVIGVNLGTAQTYFNTSPPAAGQQPAAVSPEAIDDQRGLLVSHRRTLAIYLKQLAQHGSANAPPSIEHGIREARAAIHHAKAALRGWGLAVDDHPDDTALAD